MVSAIRTPPSLPLPLRDGYSDSYEETRSRVAMTTGHDRVRQLYRSSPRLFQVRWHLTQTQFKDFDTWFQDVINGGEYAFDTQLIDRTEVPMWFTCRFLPASYTSEITEWDNWLVTASLWSNAPSFYERASGTDELNGRQHVVTVARGALMISIGLRGEMHATTVARARFYVPFTAKVLVARVTTVRGALYTGFRGAAKIETVAKGALRVNA